MTGKKTFLDKTNPLDKLSRIKQLTESSKEIPVVTELDPNEEKIPLKNGQKRPNLTEYIAKRTIKRYTF